MRAETNALKALLETSPQLAGRVFIGPAKVPPPYVVIWPLPGEDSEETWTGPATAEVHDWSVLACGETTEQAMWCDERVQAVLAPKGQFAYLGEALLRRDSHGGLERDATASPAVWFVTSTHSTVTT